MPANSNALTQNAQGRWDLTLRHDKSNVGLEIPVKLTYRGTQVSMTVKDTEQTVNTGWYTELGVPIDVNDIIKYAQPVIKGGKTYTVTGWTIDVEPYHDDEDEDEITYKLAVVAQDASIAHDGTTQLYGTYQKYVNGIHDPSSDIMPGQSSISWVVVSGSDFASVNNEGVLTASNGTDSQQTVVVKGTYEGATGSTSVVVASNSGGEVVIPVLVISAQKQTLEQNEEVQLTATYYAKVGDELGPGTDVTNSCTWISDKPDHISVTENGLAKNISVWYEDAAALITATYISPVGECEDTITLTGKAKEYYAVFADTQNTTNSGSGQVTGFTVSANTSYHFEYSSDWLVGAGVSDGTSGDSTEDEPGGKRRAYMNKTENPLTTKRYNTITIVPHWGDGDEHTLEQERGMSTIIATGLVNNLSYEEQGVNVEVTSNQRWHVSSFGDMSGMNYTNDVSYGEDKPFGPEKEFESGYTRLSLLVPENATTGDVTHSITVQTIDSPAYTASSTYSFTQGPRPVDNGIIFFSKTNSGNGSKKISYEDEDHQAKEANAQSFIFYVRTNTVCSVSVIDQGLELYDWEGNPIHGGRSAGQFFGPTDTDGIVWKPITAKIPVNPAAQWTERKRSFMFSAETIDRQTLDFNYHDKACMMVEQLGFRVIFDNYRIETFLPEVTGQTEEGVWEGPTAVTINSDSQYISPTVVVAADKWFSSYPRDEFPEKVEREVITDYLDETESGYDANLGKIYITPSQNVINHINIDNTHSGSEGLNHSALYPFKIYVSPNQSQAGIGDPIDFDLTLTYSDHDCTESKTIHYTQEHGKIVRPDLDMYVFVPVSNGGTGTQTREDNSNVYVQSGQKYVDFKLIYNGNLTPTYNLHVDGDESENVYITDESLEEYFRGAHTWPSNQTEVGIQVKLKNDLDEEFDIVVEAEAGSQTVGPEISLTIHVKLAD